MKITIVYDNDVIDVKLKSNWGFSCLVEVNENNVLFDAGGDGTILLDNVNKLGIEAAEMDAVVISHSHLDHVGGLFDLLNMNKNTKVYVPKSIEKPLKHEIGVGIEVIGVSKPVRIKNNIYTTGELGNIVKEQSMVITSEKGAIIITGCSHPGLREILDTATLNFGRVYGVIGGFHRFNDFSVLRNIKLICPCHCTQHKQKIAELFPKAFTKCGVGKVIEI